MFELASMDSTDQADRSRGRGNDLCDSVFVCFGNQTLTKVFGFLQKPLIAFYFNSIVRPATPTIFANHHFRFGKRNSIRTDVAAQQWAMKNHCPTHIDATPTKQTLYTTTTTTITNVQRRWRIATVSQPNSPSAPAIRPATAAPAFYSNSATETPTSTPLT